MAREGLAQLLFGVFIAAMLFGLPVIDRLGASPGAFGLNMRDTIYLAIDGLILILAAWRCSSKPLVGRDLASVLLGIATVAIGQFNALNGISRGWLSPSLRVPTISALAALAITAAVLIARRALVGAVR